jgi:hypothetical protein
LIWNTYYREHIPHSIAPCGSFWWKEVFKLTPIFRGIGTAKIGDSTSVLFWKDLWLPHINNEEFPRAYSYAIREDSSVKEILTASRLSDNFLLPLSPEAMNELRMLQAQTLDVILTENTHDTWKYAWVSDCYSPRMYYKFCFREMTPHCAFKWIWKSKCTPKLNFFAWLVLSDRLNTRNILKRR